eukprot:gene13494-9301_t
MILNHFTQHISTRSIIDQGYVYNSYFVLTHHLICVVSKVKTLDRPPGELTVLANMHNIVRLLDVFLRMLAWLVKHFLLAQLFVFVSQKKKIYCHFLIAYNFSFLRSENTNYYSNYLSHFSTFSRNIFAFVFPHTKKGEMQPFIPHNHVAGLPGRLERPPAPPGRNLCLAEKALIVECAVLKFILFVCLFVCLFFAFSTPGSLNAPAPRPQRRGQNACQGCEATLATPRISPHNPPPLPHATKKNAASAPPTPGGRQVKVFLFILVIAEKGDSQQALPPHMPPQRKKTRPPHMRRPVFFFAGPNRRVPGRRAGAPAPSTNSRYKEEIWRSTGQQRLEGRNSNNPIDGYNRLELLNVSVSCSLGSCLFGLIQIRGTTGSKRVNGLIRCGFVESQNFGFQVGADTVSQTATSQGGWGCTCECKQRVSTTKQFVTEYVKFGRNELQDFGDGRNWINLLDARWCLLQPPGSGSSARPIKRFRSQSAQHAVDLLLPMKRRPVREGMMKIFSVQKKTLKMIIFGLDTGGT